jgi:hypothetical protein
MDFPDFDEWVALFQENPEAFERKRQEFLEQYIEEEWAGDPDRQQRARAMLWRMEQNFRHIGDPTERFNMVVAEFWEQVNKFNDALHRLKDEL